MNLLMFLDDFSISMKSIHRLPFVLSPLYIVFRAVTAKKYEIAADLYWNMLLLPTNMLSPKVAIDRLKEDLDANRLPFYIEKLEEVETLKIAWRSCNM